MRRIFQDFAVMPHSDNRNGVSLGILQCMLIAGLLAPSVLQADETGIHIAKMAVYARNLSPARATELKIDGVHGVEVTAIESNSPASKAGIVAGDVIITFQTLTMEDVNRFKTIVQRMPPGSLLELEIMRNAKRSSVLLQTTGDLTLLSAVRDCFKQAGLTLGLEVAGTAVLCLVEGTFAHELGLCQRVASALAKSALETAAGACVEGLASSSER
jgi:hypothetical protein